MNLTPKRQLKEFNRYLFEEIDLKFYQYKYLNDYLGKIKRSQKPFYDLSIINTLNDGWILILHSDILLIYGDKWHFNQFEEMQKVFDLNKYTNFTLAGDEGLINALIEFYKPKNFKIEKRRIFYQTKQIENFYNEGLKICLGKLDDLEELAKMLQHYYHEEYNGQNDKSIEEMLDRVLSLIEIEAVHILKDAGGITLSFCTTIDPDIGILYTKEEYRNKGYAKIILSYCSQNLLKKNHTVYLMTDAEKPESNYVCRTVGFKPYFNYLMTTINIK